MDTTPFWPSLRRWRRTRPPSTSAPQDEALAPSPPPAELAQAAAALGLGPATRPVHVLAAYPARRGVSTGIPGEPLQERVHVSRHRRIRLRNYGAAIHATGPVWTMDIAEVDPARLPAAGPTAQEFDWDLLFALTEVEDWTAFYHRFFGAHLGRIAAHLLMAFSPGAVREGFLAIVQRLLTEGRLVHAQPGRSLNELAAQRPLPLWDAPAAVMVDCYLLHWPDLLAVDYDQRVEAYCAWYLQFAWVADDAVLRRRGLENHQAGGLWYDGCEFARAGEWRLTPTPSATTIPRRLSLQRHLARLGTRSLDTFARWYFGRRWDRQILTSAMKFESVPREDSAETLLTLLELLVRRGWLVHADPRASWERKLAQGRKPLRSWRIDPHHLVDCLRVHWPRSHELSPPPYHYCELMDQIEHYDFAWVARGWHLSYYEKDRRFQDTPGSLYYGGEYGIEEVAQRGEWE
ncbi:MAG: hypothetical protein OWQ56_06440 [Acidithiobacillus caldus]|nr:hypothetical protein [Acidithiobacillus caldus]